MKNSNDIMSVIVGLANIRIFKLFYLTVPTIMLIPISYAIIFCSVPCLFILSGVFYCTAVRHTTINLPPRSVRLVPRHGCSGHVDRADRDSQCGGLRSGAVMLFSGRVALVARGDISGMG